MRVPVSLRTSSPGRRPRRVYVEQHGCATTQGEAMIVRGILRDDGHVLVDREEDAESVVLLTCTVIERTERAMLRRIREVTAAGRDLVVSGCMASAQVATIKHASPHARILPPASIHQVAEVLADSEVEFCYAPKVGLPKVRDPASAVDTVVIAEGCSGACSFCITKIARPGLRSYPVEGIAADVARAVASGAVEIRLTGQDVGAYGLDSKARLPALLDAVCRVPGDFRVRVGMMNPFALEGILHDLVGAFAHEKVFRFLHLPVQSGSPRILASMNRLHDDADPVRHAEAFRAKHPDLFLATDVIAGFPGETEEDFALTMNLLDRLDPDVVNVTRFSAREGTRAADLADAVPGSEAKARSRILTAFRECTGRRRFGEWVGRVVPVIVTEQGKAGTVLARTDAYRQVALPEAPLGARGLARITAATSVDLRGEWVETPRPPMS